MIDSTQQAAPGQQPAGAGQATVVCIAAKPDGTFMVYPQGQEKAAQPFTDIDDAVQAVETMLTGQGQGSGAPGSDAAGAGDDSGDGSDAEQLFQNGFSGARNPLQGS